MGFRNIDDDTGLTQGAYLTNEKRLYEVVEVTENYIRLLNVASEGAFWIPREGLRTYRVVVPESDPVDSLI